MIEQKQQSILRLAAIVLILLAATIAMVLAVKPKKEPAQNNLPTTNTTPLRRTWRPVLAAWYGQEAPDFTLMDINGREHKLSNYRGRNVLLTFWATWCPPCKAEIPSLITLRKTTGEDKLAILAISDEPPTRVKQFADYLKINYAVFSYDAYYMARPYNLIEGVPTSFFIDPQGKIKIITEGTVPLDEIRSLLDAKQRSF